MSLNTIEFTSEAGVRAVLLALCEDAKIKKKALGLIAKLEPHAIHRDSTYVLRNGASLKPKTAGESICIQCGKAFWEGENRVKRCSYHHGMLEPDDRVWRLYNMEDAVTVEKHYEKFPDRFLWACCDRDGTEQGCRFSRHVSDPRRSKTARTARTGPRDDDVGSLSSWTAEEKESESEVEESEEEEEEEEEWEDEEDEEEEGEEDEDEEGGEEKNKRFAELADDQAMGVVVRNGGSAV